MRSKLLLITTAACLSLTMMPAAHADTKIVETTKIDCPGIQSMLKEIPEEKRAPLMKMVSPMLNGEPWITTTYLSQTKMRTDMGETSIIVDAAHKTSMTVNRQTHTYSIGPYDPYRKEIGNMTAQIEPTNQTSTVLGHKVVKYLLHMTSSIMPNSQIEGEIWSAPGMAQPLSSHYSGGMAGMLEAEMKKVKGMPLAYGIVYKNTPFGNITVYSVATSITNEHLAEHAFTVPSYYKRGATSTAPGMPSVGFPIGDGMPLDTGAASADASGMDSMLGGGGGGLSGLTQALGSGGQGGAGNLDLGALTKALGSSGGGQGLGLGGGSGSGSDGAGLGQLLQSLQGSLKSLDSMDEDAGQ